MLGPMITALVLAEPSRTEPLATTLAALVPAVADGLIGDAVVMSPSADGDVADLAEAVGATFLVAPSDPWAAGSSAARRDWVLCLAAGDFPSEGWVRALDRFIALAPADRRYGRLQRREAGFAQRLRALARLARPNTVRSGDLIHRSLLQDGGARMRPTAIAAFVERDPACG